MRGAKMGKEIRDLYRYVLWRGWEVKLYYYQARRYNEIAPMHPSRPSLNVELQHYIIEEPR